MIKYIDIGGFFREACDFYDHCPRRRRPLLPGDRSKRFCICLRQLPLDPATGAFVPGGTSEQAEQSIKNLLAVLEAAGCKAEDVVKTTVFMIDIGDFGVVNEVYGKYFSGECPARCAMQAAALPKGALVEIEAIAVKP